MQRNQHYCIQNINEYFVSAFYQRVKLMFLNRGLKVDAIPKIVNIFSRSKNISVMKGRTHYLLRKQPNSRKRILLDREIEDKEEIKVKEKEITDKIKNLR